MLHWGDAEARSALRPLLAPTYRMNFKLPLHNYCAVLLTFLGGHRAQGVHRREQCDGLRVSNQWQLLQELIIRAKNAFITYLCKANSKRVANLSPTMHDAQARKGHGLAGNLPSRVQVQGYGFRCEKRCETRQNDLAGRLKEQNMRVLCYALLPS